MSGTGQSARREAFLRGRVGEFDRAALDEAMARVLAAIPALAGLAASGFPTTNVRRWVPIGPSVIRSNNLFSNTLRGTGRVRDVAVHPLGERAYAATGKGGVWYTDTAGALWAPVGGWANRTRRLGGPNSAQSCGCLLVSFGATPADDFVLVGTGEGVMMFDRIPVRPSLGGLGVLSAVNPSSTAGAGGDPWEADAGMPQLEGFSIFRLARNPERTAGQTTGPARDKVAAATDKGLFIGTRNASGDGYTWTEPAGLATLMSIAAPAKPVVTDALWLRRERPGSPGVFEPEGRLVVAAAVDLESATALATDRSGVAFSDDAGATFTWVTNLQQGVVPPPVGRISLANPEADRVYVLGEVRVSAGAGGLRDTVWRVPAMNAATPTAHTLTGVPNAVLGPAIFGPQIRNGIPRKSQRDYNQAIVVARLPGVPAKDRIFLGGDVATPHLGASVWCFDVDVAAAPTALVAADRISSSAALAAGGQGAVVDGLIGNDVHADVHSIRLAQGDPARVPHEWHVWVGCDGGVFVSTQGGRVNTFASRATAFAAVEVNFLAAHPTSSHFMAIGTQDNGRHVRTGDVVWEDTMGGDGGGVAFHQVKSQFIVSQFTRGGWGCAPDDFPFLGGPFVDPLNRDSAAPPPARENDLSSFYSGAASARRSATVGRIAIGTNRVWLTDDLGTATPNTWRALPYPSGPATDPRPLGADAPVNQNTGLPQGAPLGAAAGGNGPLGVITAQKWANPNQLLVLFTGGIVRWTQNPATGNWATELLLAPGGVAPTTGGPDPATTVLTDLAPVPESRDFYLTTTGDRAAVPGDTCFFYDDAASTFRPTSLRQRIPAVPPQTVGPLDPAYAVVVDPATPTHVYVGTVTGVWQGVRTPGVAAHAWTPEVNGLPEAAIQDLNIWTDPSSAAGSPRLLRAAVQSRGVWEMDLAAPVTGEPERTYIRVHARDDRRRLPTPMADPRRRPSAPAVPAFASPDIVIRPQWPGPAPTWRFGSAGVIDLFNPHPYELWTFQTAFRWRFPSVVANGEWSTPFEELLKARQAAAGLPIAAAITEDLWNDVVLGTRITTTGSVSSSPVDPLAVYRPPWHSPAAMNQLATELDLVETVQMPGLVGDVQQVFREPNTIEVLVHHRDTRPRPLGDAFVILLWHDAANQAAALGASVAGIPAYVTSVIGGGPPAPPAPWHLAPTATGDARHPLSVALDARMPRAVPINVNLTGVANRVVFLAIVGSTVDPCTVSPVSVGTRPPPPPPPTTLEGLVQRWPYAAMRLVQVINRPP